MSARERFEAWARTTYPTDSAPAANVYARDHMQAAWNAWQAARAEALEEAANVCDDEAAEWEAQVEAAGKLSSITKHAVESTAVGARRCARRISALAGSGA